MARRIGRALAWSAVGVVGLVALVATVLPPFLDRVYYQGPVSDHFDGERFFNPDGDDTGVPTGGSRAGFFWSRLTGAGQPDWPASVAVRPSPPVERPPLKDGEMRVTWVGHATALIETPGLNILTDPVWSDRAGPFGFGPKRVAEPGVRFEDLPPIDLVLVSHNHYDHMDLATLKRLWERDRPAIVTSLGNDALIRQVTDERCTKPMFPHGCEAAGRIEALDWARGNADSVVAGFTAIRRRDEPAARPSAVIVTRNHHWGSRWSRDRNRALWSSFIIDTPSGAVFFAGDTGLGDGKWPAEALRSLAALGAQRAGNTRIRLALIPIGAFRFKPGQLNTGSHVGPPDALRVWNRLGRPWTLPIHWGTFRLSSEAYDTPPKMLAELMRCTGGPPDAFAAHEIGRSWMVPPAAEHTTIDEALIAPCTRTEAVRALR